MEREMRMTIAAALRAWLDGESRMFTALCGESFTRREVVKVGLGTLAILAAAIAAGGM